MFDRDNSDPTCKGGDGVSAPVPALILANTVHRRPWAAWRPLSSIWGASAAAAGPRAAPIAGKRRWRTYGRDGWGLRELRAKPSRS